MKTLSIDVGIKNLAYCLLDDHKIERWGVVNLIEDLKKSCDLSTKNVKCANDAKFKKNDTYYCTKHAKKEEFIIPTNETKKSTINKMTIADLQSLAIKYNITQSPATKKSELVAELYDYFKTQAFESVENINAGEVDLVILGKALKTKFDEIFNTECVIECVIIENQISPIANRMKTIQGMIAQYFIMKNSDIRVEFISASNKLKLGLTESGTPNAQSINNMTYNQRKKLGVEKCAEFIRSSYTEWYQFFINNKKKDDLADAFLQGKWFLAKVRNGER